MIRTPFLVALALCATAVLHCWSSLGREVQAGTALAMHVSDLVDRSSAIVEGRVVDKRSFIAASGRIETEYRLSVARSFLSVPGTTFTFRAPGGVLPDGRGMLIAGLPELARGEDAILFLSAESAGGTRMPVGLAQGRFSVVVDAHGAKSLVRDASGLDLVDASGALLQGTPARTSYDYAALTSEIEALVATRDQRARERAEREASAGKGR